MAAKIDEIKLGITKKIKTGNKKKKKKELQLREHQCQSF